jgi:nitrogen fixation protein NifU and related proteins
VSVSREVYQELILQHSRHPRHHGALPEATHAATGDNPLCGDRYEVRLRVDESGVIRDAAFEGAGCAISKASASLMLDAVIGLSREEFERLFQDFHLVVRGDPQAPEAQARLGKLAVFANIWKYPSRVKCAILCWHAVRSALAGKGEARTEERPAAGMDSAS